LQSIIKALKLEEIPAKNFHDAVDVINRMFPPKSNKQVLKCEDLQTNKSSLVNYFLLFTQSFKCENG